MNDWDNRAAAMCSAVGLGPTPSDAHRPAVAVTEDPVARRAIHIFVAAAHVRANNSEAALSELDSMIAFESTDKSQMRVLEELTAVYLRAEILSAFDTNRAHQALNAGLTLIKDAQPNPTLAVAELRWRLYNACFLGKDDALSPDCLWW
jgi:hypothetical protein